MSDLIQKFQIKKRFRGLDEKQVETVISELASEIEKARDETNQYKSQLDQASLRVAQLNERFELLQKELAYTQNTGEEITRVALKEANVLIEKAKRNADLILAEALQNLKEVNRDIERFKKEAVDFKDGVQTLSTSLLEQVEQSHIYFMAKHDRSSTVDDQFIDEE